jgi:hypothetical protein
LVEEELRYGGKKEREFPELSEISKSLKSFEVDWILLDDSNTSLNEKASEE